MRPEGFLFGELKIPRGKAPRNLPMQGIVFYYSIIARSLIPQQAVGLALAVYSQFVSLFRWQIGKVATPLRILHQPLEKLKAGCARCQEECANGEAVSDAFPCTGLNNGR
jgi:hypothetical protein